MRDENQIPSSVIQIIRQKTDVFLLDGQFLLDKRLSFMAKGIYSYLSKYPDKPFFNTDLLEIGIDSDISKIDIALKNLIDCGYFECSFER